MPPTFDTFTRQVGGGLLYLARANNPDDVVAFKIIGDVFPRVVIDPTGHVKTGNGATPPTDISGGGGAVGMPVYNVVLSYAVDPTGAASAVAGVNQAITDANLAGGGIVLFVPGTYKVDGDLVLKSNVVLMSDGYGAATLFDARANGNTIISAGTNGAPIQRAKVEGFTFIGSGPTGTQHAVDLSYSEHCVVTENKIVNYGFGVFAHGTTAAYVARNHFLGCSSNNGNNQGAVHVIANGTGETSDCHIVENVFDGCLERGIVILGNGAHRPGSIHVSANAFLDTNTRGRRIDVRVSQGAKIVDNTFAISAFDGGFATPFPAVYVADAQGCDIRSNRFVLTGTGIATACVQVDAGSAASLRVAVVDNEASVAAGAKPTVAMILWTSNAPNYNLRGTDWGNSVSLDASANTVLCSGMPDTITPTHQWGPINVREYCVGDGVAYDGPALVAFKDACLAQGREGRFAAGIYLAQSDASTPTPITIDKSIGANGQSVFTGEGEGTTTVRCNVNLGLDVYGNPNSIWNPINCGQDQSVDVFGVSFEGAQRNITNANLNPNATPISQLVGYGPRIANRGRMHRCSSRGFYVGLLVDGQINSGQYLLVSKVDATNTATVDVTTSPTPPATLIGMTAAGSGIPNNTTVTNVVGNVITFSNNFNNAAGTQPLDLACYTVGSPGSARVASTDHHEVQNFKIEKCRLGLYTRRNSGVSGGGGTGTADFVYHRLTIGLCQWAGVVASEDGYYRDVTFDSVHVANITYSFLKEGNAAKAGQNGKPTSQNTFIGDVMFVRTKSEGAGGYALYDVSGTAICNNWNGLFEIHGGIEINAGKTHKFISGANFDHSYKPFTGTARRDASGRITVTCADSSVVAIGKMLAVESLSGGSNPDASFVDCAVVETIPDGTHFTALVGAQTKTVTMSFNNGDNNGTVSGNPNAQAQDVGCIITGTGIPPATFVGVVNFGTQNVTFVDAAGNPVTATAPSAGTYTFTLPAVAIDVNVRFGLIGGMRLGEIVDWNLNLDISSAPTTGNIAPEQYWDFDTIKSKSRIEVTNAATDFPSIDLRTGQNFTSTGARFIRGDAEAWICQASAAINIGDALKFTTNGKVAPTSSADAATVPRAGIARCGAGNGATMVTVNPVPGVAPFVVVNRPWVMVQNLGSTFKSAIVDGGGVNVAAGTAQAKLLVPSAVAGVLAAWDGTTHGLPVMAESMSAEAGGKCDANVVAPYIT